MSERVRCGICGPGYHIGDESCYHALVTDGSGLPIESAGVPQDEALGDLIEPVSTHVLLYMGYSAEQVAALAEPFDHAAHGCEFDTNHMGWDCTDENGEPLHPEDDDMSEVVETVRVALEAPALADLLRGARAEALREAASILAVEANKPPHMLSNSAQRVWMGGMDAAGRIVAGLAARAVRVDGGGGE